MLKPATWMPGIVYSDDALSSTKVKVVASAPADINAKIVYPAAVVAASKNQDAAKDYLNFLFSDQAKAIFEKYGFTWSVINDIIKKPRREILMAETYLSPLWISLRTVTSGDGNHLFPGDCRRSLDGTLHRQTPPCLDGLFILPLVLPPTVVGLGLLLLFGKHGPIGQFLALFNTTIVFSWPATVISAAVMSFPLMYMTSRGAFEQVDTHVEDAARTLGASEWRVFWSVTLPLAWPAVVGSNHSITGSLPGRVRSHIDAGRQYPR